MESNFTYISQKDGYHTRLFYYKTLKDQVLGNVLILHGMAEHHGRYMDFIHALTQQGFDVYTYDHRGHGTDKKLSELGFVAKRGGASQLIEDALTICRHIKETGRSEKLAVFGHSMGSMILRCLLTEYREPVCAIVSSSTMPPTAVSGIGIFLANILCLFRGAKKPSPFLQKVLFGGKAYSSLCTRTSFDWLTRNNTIVGRYMDDPYCGFICTTSFYRDLATLSYRSALKRTIKTTRKDMPILFLTGDRDPVGGYASQIIKLQRLYKKLGFTQTSLTVYPEDRHELLNELNAEEVYSDIITYLHTHLD